MPISGRFSRNRSLQPIYDLSTRKPIPKRARSLYDLGADKEAKARNGPADLFEAASRMGLEGIVSKRRDRPYKAGRSKHWVKMKNRQHSAMSRVMEAFG
jgi:ATP-dependent DNA ligase